MSHDPAQQFAQIARDIPAHISDDDLEVVPVGLIRRATRLSATAGEDEVERTMQIIARWDFPGAEPSSWSDEPRDELRRKALEVVAAISVPVGGEDAPEIVRGMARRWWDAVTQLPQGDARHLAAAKARVLDEAAEKLAALASRLTPAHGGLDLAGAVTGTKSPATPAEEEPVAAVREAVARLIEPGAWADHDARRVAGEGDNGRIRRDREWSLERADQIIALLPATPTTVVPEGLRDGLRDAIGFIEHISSMTGYPGDELAREEFSEKLSRYRTLLSAHPLEEKIDG
jgi:hypothetical protein